MNEEVTGRQASAMAMIAALDAIKLDDYIQVIRMAFPELKVEDSTLRRQMSAQIQAMRFIVKTDIWKGEHLWELINAVLAIREKPLLPYTDKQKESIKKAKGLTDAHEDDSVLSLFNGAGF